MQPAGQLEIKVKSWSKPWSLWAMSDWHLMNRGCHEKLLDATLARIQNDPRALWTGLGDLADMISMRDKRFDPESIAEGIRVKDLKTLGPVARDRVIEKVLPIADKCVGMLHGNHEWHYGQKFEQSVIEDATAAMNAHLKSSGSKHRVPFMHYSGFRDLVFIKGKRRERFRLCMHHGAGYARTKGGKLNRLIQFMRQFDADIYMMGHVHTATDDVVIVIGADDACEHITHQSKVGLVTGTYLRTYVEGASGYGERAMYEPVPLGSPRVVIDVGKRTFSIEKPW